MKIVFCLLLFTVNLFCFTTGENIYSSEDAENLSLGLSLSHMPYYPLLVSSEFLEITSGELFYETPFYKISFVRPSEKISYSILAKQFKTASSDVVDEFGEYGGFFYRESFLSFSLAKKIRRFFTGISFTSFKQEIYTKQGNSFSIDTGVCWAPFDYKIISKHEKFAPFLLGVSFQNLFATDIKTGDSPEKLPLNLHTFFALNFLKGKIAFFNRFSLMDISQKKRKKNFSGIQVRIFDFLNLMAGRNPNENSFGFGFDVGRFSFYFANANSSFERRITTTLSYSFSYVSSISEKIIKTKDKEIEELKKEIQQLEEAKGGFREEERQWLLNMFLLMFKYFKVRDFTGASRVLNEVFRRYSSELEGKLQGIQISKKDARKLLLQAKDLFELKEYRKAKEVLERALIRLSGEKEAEELNTLVNAYISIEEGNFKEARRILSEGLSVNPKSPQIIDLLRRVKKLMEVLGK